MLLPFREETVKQNYEKNMWEIVLPISFKALVFIVR